MSAFGTSFSGRAFGSGNAVRYVHISKQTLAIGTVHSVSIPRSVQVSQTIFCDIDETANASVEVSMYRQTANGESPQIQCVVGTGDGGGGKSETIISPGARVTIDVTVSGASIPIGITGQ